MSGTVSTPKRQKQLLQWSRDSQWVIFDKSSANDFGLQASWSKPLRAAVEFNQCDETDLSLHTFGHVGTGIAQSPVLDLNDYLVFHNGDVVAYPNVFIQIMGDEQRDLLQMRHKHFD